MNDFLNLPPYRTKRTPKVKPVVIEGRSESIKRYVQAHHDYTKKTAADFFEMSGGNGMKVNVPNVNTHDGLRAFVVNFTDWIGGMGNKINIQSRQIGKQFDKLESGATMDTRQTIASSTKTGTPDTDLQIPHPKHFFGIHVYCEIKVGRDTQRDTQYCFMNKVDGTGGVYVIVRSPEQWFEFYDKIIKYADGV